MQFDHVEGVRMYDIGAMWTRPKYLVLHELSKCVIRCANCHAIRHYGHAYEGVS